jgi:hypothetical protein
VAERIAGLKFRPATCSCVIRYGQYVDMVLLEPDWSTGTLEPEEIVSQCEAHEGLTTVEALHDQVTLENTAFGQAAGEIKTYRGAGTYPKITVWEIDEDRQILITVMGAAASLQTRLNAIDNILCTFVPIS